MQVDASLRYHTCNRRGFARRGTMVSRTTCGLATATLAVAVLCTILLTSTGDLALKTERTSDLPTLHTAAPAPPSKGATSPPRPPIATTKGSTTENQSGDPESHPPAVPALQDAVPPTNPEHLRAAFPTSARNVHARRTSPPLRWSTHRCIGGGGLATLDAATKRSCHFTNVCWHGKARQWVYFSPEGVDTPLVFLDKSWGSVDALGGHHLFAYGVAADGAASPTVLRVVHMEAPSHAQWAPAPWNVFVLPIRWEDTWTFFSDGLLGTFWLQSVFGQFSHDNQLLVANPKAPELQPAAHDTKYWRHSLVSPGLTRRPVMDLDGLRVNRSQLGDPSGAADLTCFRNVLMGQGELVASRTEPPNVRVGPMGGVRLTGL